MAAFKAACRQELDSTPTSTYSRRIHDSLHAYHTRDFVYRVPPVRPLPRPPHDATVHVQPRGSGTPWVGRFAPYVPEGNLENGTGAVEAQRAYHLDAARDRMRVMYIKSFKVGSTTVGSIFARLAVTRGMTLTPGRLFNQPHPYPYDCLYAHNYFVNGNSGGFPACLHVINDGGPTWCGGYQPWMEFYMPRAWRVVMVGEPVSRMASLFYYEKGFTRAVISKDGTELMRAKDTASLGDPLDQDCRIQMREYMLGYGKKRWDHIQWHWLREGTPNRSLDEVIEMLLNGAFLVGLTEHFDESLLLWRHFMGLFVEDILYFKMKGDFSHPNVTDWHVDDQRRARDIVDKTGDARYYATARDVFEHQVTVYGGWDKLRADTAAFRAVNKRLNDECSGVVTNGVGMELYRRAVCLVAKYRKHGLAAQFGEA